MRVTPIGAEHFGSGHPRLGRGSKVARNVIQLASPFTVETITDAAGLEGLRPAWDALLESSESECVFLTWEWFSTWWKYFGEPGTLEIFVLRLNAEITAIAPFRIRPAGLRERQGFPVLEFLGSGHVGSDYLDLIIRKGFEDDSLDALARAWQSANASRRFGFRWTNIRQEHSLAARAASLLEQDGWTSDESTINVCPYISLGGCSWESYLETLGAEHRGDFRRKWKRLNRDFAVEFAQADQDTRLGFIDRLIEQHNRRWQSRGGSDAFHTQALIDFHREVSQQMLDRGWLRLYALRLNGEPVALLYGFLFRGKFCFYQSSFDTAFEKYSVGTVIMGLAIQRAIVEGAVEYDFLHGDETYKSHWSRESRTLARLELYPPGVRGWLGHRYMKMGRFTLKLARRVLNNTAAK
ncbi:MAG TPA: GNAT family N-acetyltransferase [Bryobacteraceae bacterium]|nr:GNAT family N-acetyltransferase [Bryobacteraceae bacterium]